MIFVRFHADNFYILSVVKHYVTNGRRLSVIAVLRFSNIPICHAPRLFDSPIRGRGDRRTAGYYIGSYVRTAAFDDDANQTKPCMHAWKAVSD